MSGRDVSLLFIGICLAVAGLSATVLWWSGEREDLEDWMANVASTQAPKALPLPLHKDREPVRFDLAVPSPFSGGGEAGSVLPGRRR